VALRILALVLAAAAGFAGLAVVEEWPLFSAVWRGRSPLPPRPAEAEVEQALRAFARALETGGEAGRGGSPAAREARSDRAFRRARGVRQRLQLQRLAVQEVTPLGPALFAVVTEEESVLEIGRGEARARRFRVIGTWRYRLLQTSGVGLQVTDATPLAADLVPLSQEAAP